MQFYIQRVSEIFKIFVHFSVNVRGSSKLPNSIKREINLGTRILLTYIIIFYTRIYDYPNPPIWIYAVLKFPWNSCKQPSFFRLRVVAHSRWDWRKYPLHLYRSLIRSKLDYGAVVYGSARKSYLRMLEPIQKQALRLCLRAFRSSPATSLHIEANEMPLDVVHLRRRKLASQ